MSNYVDSCLAERWANGGRVWVITLEGNVMWEDLSHAEQVVA